jgi:hypothetical protein
VTTVTCTATDSSGNTATGTFTVTVQDTTAPTLACPADQVAEATGPGGATVTYPAATATDLVDASVSITSSPAAGSTFPLGVTTIVVTATDDAGNTATCTFTVTVRDTRPPTITCSLGRQVIWSPSSGMIDVLFAASATDAGTARPTVTIAIYSDEPVGTGVYSPDATLSGGTLRLRAERNSTSNGRTYVIVITARDAAGNEARSGCYAVVPITMTSAWISTAKAEATAAVSWCSSHGGAAPFGWHTVLPSTTLP